MKRQKLMFSTTPKHIIHGSMAVLAAMALSLGVPCTSVMAQETKGGDSASHTITLKKMVEVYEFEDLKVTTGQYVVEKGDSLDKILKKRGLMPKKKNQAQLVRLVRHLNPDLKDLNALSPGQVLIMPAPLSQMSENKAATDPGPIIASINRGTETVKIYERPQRTQSPAKVVVMRHVDDPLPQKQTQGQEAGNQKGPAAAAERKIAKHNSADTAMPPGKQQSNIANNAIDLIDYPSGNTGELNADSDGVVYRTVRVQKGDTLEKLLRREGMDHDLIYRHLLKITLKLNPEIKNANMIFVGAELKIPAAGAYLATANIDPNEVRQAALLASEGKKSKEALSRKESHKKELAGTIKTADKGGAPKTTGKAAVSTDKNDTAKSSVSTLPPASIEIAQSTIGYIFTSLGERFTAKGNLVLTAGSKTINIDSAAFPIVELKSGINIIIDLESKLPNSTFAAIRAHHPQYMLFRTAPKENLENALDKLWPLCGYYRIYKKDRTYEGGTDIRLKLAADWIIWPTEESWNTGRPLVISKASKGGKPAYLGWSAFLSSNGIKLIDIYKSNILPGPSMADRQKDLPVINIDPSDPSAAAIEIVKLFGVEAKKNFQPNLKGKASSHEINIPVYWEKGKSKVALHFGDLNAEAIKRLRSYGYKVINSQSTGEDVLKTIINAFGVKSKNAAVLSAPAGGPQMSLTIKGLSFSVRNNDYFLSDVPLPSGMGALSNKLTVIKFEAPVEKQISMEQAESTRQLPLEEQGRQKQIQAIN